MKSYNPYFVESISQHDEENNFYVFDVMPPRSIELQKEATEDFYFELHIKTIGYPIYYKDFLQGYIHVELIDKETIEIYEGEYYEESFSNGPFKYEFLELKKHEKALKSIWKGEFKNLELTFRNLSDQKLSAYIDNRDKVAKRYQQIYNKSLSGLQAFGLNEENVSKPFLFRNLYQLFSNSPAEASLNRLIDVNYGNWKQHKSWKQDFDDLHSKYQLLQHFDLSNYKIIRDHIADVYTKTYKHMMPSLLYNYKDIDEHKYDRYFDHLMNELKADI